MFMEPSWLWNAVPTRFQKCRPLLSTMLYAAQGLRPLPPFADCCSFSIFSPLRLEVRSQRMEQNACRPRATRKMAGGVRHSATQNGTPVLFRCRSVLHAEGRRQRAGDVDLPELRLVLRHVVLQRVQKALHVLGTVDDARAHHRLRRLRLHVDEVDDELRLVVV